MSNWRADGRRVFFGPDELADVIDVGNEARARLIAAAPELTDLFLSTERENADLRAVNTELLEALKRGADLCERGHGQTWAIEARALLARIEAK